jgi:hypothetical protein
VDYLIIFYYAEYWGGVENFFGEVDILFGGVIANIGGGVAPPTKSVYELFSDLGGIQDFLGESPHPPLVKYP